MGKPWTYGDEPTPWWWRACVLIGTLYWAYNAVRLVARVWPCLWAVNP